MAERIVITGMGAVTPVGIGVKAYLENLAAGKCGIGDITRMDTENLALKRAAEVKDFDAKELLGRKLASDMEPFMHYAYVSAVEAIEMSGIEAAGSRTGIVMGTALAGITLIGDTEGARVLNGKATSPKFLTKAMGNIAAAQLSINYGIKGPSMTVATACSSGGDAITLAAMMIRAGAADAMIVMAGEAAICHTLTDSLIRAGALSKTGESRPFDKNRNGFVLGEGGGALVVERESHAKARGADILAVLAGSANNTDAYNLVAPDPEGEGAAECMRLALKNAGLEPKDIGYINAHGTATKAGDAAESGAIHAVFGCSPVSVSSTKGATGHMMGAGGITEVIACVNAVRNGVIPPNLGYSEKDEDCDLKIAAKTMYGADIKAALSNAMGFGGQNSCVIVSRYEEHN